MLLKRIGSVWKNYLVGQFLVTVFVFLATWGAGALTGHLFLEVFEPGDYYASDRTAYFFRWQLNWAF